MKKNNLKKNWKKTHRFRKNKHGIRYIHFDIDLEPELRKNLDLFCKIHNISRKKAINIAINEKIEQNKELISESI